MCQVASAGQVGSHESSETPSRRNWGEVDKERRENSQVGKKE